MNGVYISGIEIIEKYKVKHIELLDAINSRALRMVDRHGKNIYIIKSCLVQCNYDSIHKALIAAREEAKECDCLHKTLTEIISESIEPKTIEDFDEYEYQRIREFAVLKLKKQASDEYKRARELMYTITPPKGGEYFDSVLPKDSDSVEHLFDFIGKLLYFRREVERVFGVESLDAGFPITPSVDANNSTGSGHAISTSQQNANRLRAPSPSPEVIKRLKGDGWSNERIAERYPELFGHYSNNKETVRGRINGYLRGTYKGHIREP